MTRPHAGNSVLKKTRQSPTPFPTNPLQKCPNRFTFEIIQRAAVVVSRTLTEIERVKK